MADPVFRQGDLVLWTRKTRQGVIEIAAAYQYLTQSLVAIEVQTHYGPAIKFVDRKTLKIIPGWRSNERRH